MAGARQGSRVAGRSSSREAEAGRRAIAQGAEGRRLSLGA